MPEAKAEAVPTITVEGSTYKVVKGEIPPELLRELGRDFTPEEKHTIFARIHKTIAPSVKKPIALWVFGPSAVGKSFLSNAKANVLFGNLQNAVLVDGAEFREVHAGFQAVALHGMKHGLLHAEAWDVLKGTGKVGDGFGICGQLKRRIIDEALRDRQHIIIPDCANRLNRLLEMLDTVAAAGYEMHAICLWAPLSETRKRGEPRSVREGKKWSARGYADATKGTLELAKRWKAGQQSKPETWASLSMWDNTIFPSMEITLEQLERLTNMTNEEADAHAIRCKQQADMKSPSAIAMRNLRVTSDVVKFIGNMQQRWEERNLLREAAENASDAKVALFIDKQLRDSRWRGRLEGVLCGSVACAVAFTLMSYRPRLA